MRVRTLDHLPGPATDSMTLSRRDLLRQIAGYATMLALPAPVTACGRGDRGDAAEMATDTLASRILGEPPPAYPPPTVEDERRLLDWTATLRRERLVDVNDSPGEAAARVGELARGTPYEAFTLEEYIRAGGSPSRTEPLTLHLDRFDCVSLVEACLAIARVAHHDGDPTWDAFAHEMERMRYRGGTRGGYVSRLHYFSEWIDDNAQRGLVRVLGEELGGQPDTRPLRFMSSNPDAYPALAVPEVLEAIREIERSLDDHPRWVIPTERIREVEPHLRTGDILAFATAIEGLDVTHAAFAYQDAAGTMRVLHAPLSGGVVEVTRSTLPEYVAAIRSSTGILVARPLWG